MSPPRVGRRPRGALVLLLAWLAAGPALLGGDPRGQEVADFLYDEPDRRVESGALGGDGAYEPHLAARGDDLVATWLEHVPGEGDRLHVERLGDSAPFATSFGQGSARYSRPTLTALGDDDWLLTYEAQDPERGWNLFALRAGDDGDFVWHKPVRVNRVSGGVLSHVTAADGAGGAWAAWQAERDGEYDVLLHHLNEAGEPELVSRRGVGDWAPSIAVTESGDVCVAWDAYTGESFDVLARWRTDGEWGPVLAVASGPRFQGRAQLESDGTGGVFVAWEEGPENWGGRYRSVNRLWNNATDARGPLHRTSALRLARLAPDGRLERLASPSMPSFALAATRANARPGVAQLGCFYERPELAVDARGRPWVAYRHYYEPQCGCVEETRHHVEEGFRLYARALGADGWGPLVGFGAPQRDGTQRLSLVTVGDELAAAWATGRTDRRRDPLERGVAFARFAVGGGAAPEAGTGAPAAEAATSVDVPEARASVEVAGQDYELFFGDLHRHTDLSLCFPFYDGSLDDAYRYAIEVEGLDFLGLTDHARDLDRGDAQSQIWWRSLKEVTRHRMGARFVPFFAYERSHADTDHNVVTLRDDVLRNYPPPLPEFWAELDRDTFTIPHNPLIGKVWEYHDEAKRPVMELYQGFRDEASEGAAQEGLDKGYRFGFIASSDHLSTGASYACVWSPSADREALFRSMQARRTYAATDRIGLAVTLDARWMGEQLALDGPRELAISVRGTAPLERIELWRDGTLVQEWTDLAGPDAELALELAPPAEGESHVHVRLLQTDGERAWSSPLFLSAE